MNNFFKDENLASNLVSKMNTNTSLNGSNKLLELQKNPWKVFPNYNKSFDDSLNELIALKNRYYNNHCAYKHLLNEKQKSPNFADVGFALSFSTLILLPISSFIFDNLKTLFSLQSSIPLTIGSILLGFLFSSLLIYGFHRVESQISLKNKYKFINSEIVKKEENFRSIERDYKKKIKSFLGDKNSLNIREHLNYYYHTNIPEINHLVHKILNKYFPEDLEITNNINDNLEPLSQISFSEYINNIQSQLNTIIENQIVHQAGNQIMVQYEDSLHDDKPSILNPEYKGQGIIVTRVKSK